MTFDIERLKIDPAYWDEVAPKGATHWDDAEFLRWTDIIRGGMRSLDVWDCGAWTTDAYGFNGTLFEFVGAGAIARPEATVDHRQVAALPRKPIPCQSQIEVSTASLISDEQAQEIGEDHPYSHYFKDVSGVDAIDLYHVAKLYEINDPCLFHAFKKIACAGKRGAKDQAQDVQESIDALLRWQGLNN